MNLLSSGFLCFLIVLAILYFLVPKRFQWVVLLAGSLFFYAMNSVRNLIFLGLTAGTAWLAAQRMSSLREEQRSYLSAHKAELTREERNAVKASFLRRRRLILAVTLVFNFGLLGVFKYLHFVIEQVSRLVMVFGSGPIADPWQLIAPLGISFYTFQTMGYLADVYWEKVPAEKNIARMLLFTSFFPQITQGPISDFKELTDELYAEHSLDYHNFAWGAMRMFWGFFKKMAVANVLAIYVQDLFANYSTYTGAAALMGAFMYSVQIYADFSGYMDIVCGYCEILGIRLTENFERPYFSKSIAEYWRRWHSSLGRWFKTYIYYPIAVARWNRNLGKRMSDRFGPAFGRALPASIALVVVWLTTGLWHGASWAYIAWGGVNGLFIIFSLWMEPVYASWKEKLHILESALSWRAFQVIRTFILVTFIKVLPEVGTLSQGLGLWRQIFTEHTIPTYFAALFPLAHTGYLRFLAAGGGTCLMFLVSMIQRKQPVRQWLTDHVPYILRIALFVVLFMAMLFIGYPLIDQSGGFMYAEF